MHTPRPISVLCKSQLKPVIKKMTDIIVTKYCSALQSEDKKKKKEAIK
jgi:hypothetical protein